MRSLTKSPIAFLRAAYDIARRYLPEYSCKKSKHVYTLHQLFALVALRIFLKLVYRGIEAAVVDLKDIRETLGLQKAPDHSTICRAQQTIMARFGDILTGSVKYAEACGMITEADKTAAVDSTGYESGHTSDYYSQRTGLTKSHYPKLTTVCLTQSHLYIWAVADKGPLPDDTEFTEAVINAHRERKFDRLLADAGYDSEKNHWLVRRMLRALSIIPPLRGRHTGKLPTGRYRKEMALNFPRAIYGQRWQAESCFSQDKRCFGSAVEGRSDQTLCDALLLIVLVHNIALICCLHILCRLPMA
jgi:hypothetical protein